jgi:hypothetical protein
VPKKQTAAEIDAKHRIYTRGLYDRLRSNPNMIREFKLTLPEVANAFEEKPDDYGLFFILNPLFFFAENFHSVFVHTNKENRRKAGLMHDENSVEGQQFLEEQLRIQRIQDQYEYAQEHMPEVFIPINLLHILVKINGVEVLAMIDSGMLNPSRFISKLNLGAQSSIISSEIAKKCNVYQFTDERYFSKASGVGGLSKIKGRIHACGFY